MKKIDNNHEDGDGGSNNNGTYDKYGCQFKFIMVLRNGIRVKIVMFD